MLNACEIDKQHVQCVKSSGCYGGDKRVLYLSHTLQLAVQESLLSQCSITDSLANSKQMESYESVYFVSTK